MAISSVSAVSSDTSAARSLGPSAADAKSQFLALLVTQLKNQSPMDPVSNEDFLAQLAQFSSLEEQQRTNASLEALIQVQLASANSTVLSQAAGFIGKTVEYTDETNGSPKSGLVQSVAVENGVVMLKIGSESVPLGTITGVKETPAKTS